MNRKLKATTRNGKAVLLRRLEIQGDANAVPFSQQAKE